MVEARLVVFWKDVDLVAETAFLTLRDKMGYAGKLLGLARFDEYLFTIRPPEGERPERAIERFEELLGAQSTFYNRNKHNHFLDCTWNGHSLSFGVALERVRESFRRTIESANRRERQGDSSVQKEDGSLKLKSGKVFLAEVLVEERGDRTRAALSRKLSSEMEGSSVEVKRRGVLWWLAVLGESAEEAAGLAEEMTVTLRRDRGLLANPNSQTYSLERIGEIGDE